MDRRIFFKMALGSAVAIPAISNKSFFSSILSRINYYTAQVKNLPVTVNIQALQKYDNYTTMPNVSILREVIIRHEKSGNILKTERKSFGTSYTFKNFESYKLWVDEIRAGQLLKDKVFSDYKISYNSEQQKHLIQNIHFSA